MNRGLQHNNKMLKLCGVKGCKTVYNNSRSIATIELDQQTIDCSEELPRIPGFIFLAERMQLKRRTTGQIGFLLDQIALVDTASPGPWNGISGEDILRKLARDLGEGVTVLSMHFAYHFMRNPNQYLDGWIGEKICLFGSLFKSTNGDLYVPYMKKNNKNEIVYVSNIRLSQFLWSGDPIALLNINWW